MTATARPVAEAQQPAHAALTRREEIAIAVFVVWCVAGLFLDGWSHNAAKPESFFTPWHGLLYSGFGASVGWGMYEGNRARLAGEPASVTVADRLTRIGTAMFVAGMVGDFGWHTLFGVEQDVEALLSPTHLLLMIGGMLLASMPLRLGTLSRPAAERRFTDVLPALVSVAATAGIVLFFLQFASAFTGGNVRDAVGSFGLDGDAQLLSLWGVLSVVITGTVLAGVSAALVQRGPLPFGTHTFVVGLLALAVNGLHGFDLAPLVLAGVAGGFAADVAVRRGRADLAPVAQAVVLWPAWFAVVALAADLRWSAELVGGAIAITVLAAFGVRELATRR
jgi:hypothetical protein